MKKTLLFASTLLISLSLLAQEQKEVVTGAGYADDVYYSLENGTVTTVARNNWDIAFVAQVMSVSILANNGSGVELYTYPDGTIDDWASVDTAGMAWTPMYNSIETWDMGAFNANTIPGDDFDYGWGRYNMITHQITGDSILLIKTLSDSIMKVAITQKDPMTNTWEFKYAYLDGSNEQTVPLSAGAYVDKYFVHYSLDSTKFVDREPAMEDWDLLFTKYYDYTIPYIVTGVLSNDGHILAQEVRESGMDQSTHNSYVDTAFADTISIIGSDWKTFDMGSFTYILNDTVVYYLKTDDGDSTTNSAYYKIYFTGFTGSSEGKYTFMQERLTFVSVGKNKVMNLLQVYPNPAADHINVVFDLVGRSEIDIIDMTGRLVRTTRYDASGFTNLSLDVSSLNPGVFFVRVSAEGESNVLRFIKE
ncbi:MAG: hypothetical protein DRI98_03645 [Bacteroidetes bacterium]|nr:MAG: hypothetical protein DRI98_03645 [Bacteroidota bacterium]